MINIALALFIMVIRKFLQSIVFYLARYQKYGTISQKAEADLIKLYVLDLLAANFLTFLAKGNIFGIDISFIGHIIVLIQGGSGEKSSTTIANDGVFNSQWYLNVGYQIWLNILLLLLVPVLLGPISFYIL